MKSKIEGVLHRATIQFNGVSNDSIPEFVVKPNDALTYKSSIFKSIARALKGARSLDALIYRVSACRAVLLWMLHCQSPTTLLQRWTLMMSVYGEDEDFIEFLNKCNFFNFTKYI
jgi:hypothetical protein